MRAKTYLVILAATTLGHVAPARALLAQFRYSGLKSAREYHTGLSRIIGGPVEVARFTVEGSGSSCRLAVTKIDYMSTSPGDVREARSAGEKSWEIPERRLYAIDVHYRYDGAEDGECAIEAYAEGLGPRPDCRHYGGKGTPGETGNWYRIYVPREARDSRDAIVRDINGAHAGVVCYTDCLWGLVISCRDIYHRGEDALTSWLEEAVASRVDSGQERVKVLGGYGNAPDTTNGF